MYCIVGNELKISVRSLVEFLVRTGDIEPSGGGIRDVKAMQEGQRIHKKIQKSMGSRYHAEFPLKCSTHFRGEGEFAGFEPGMPYVISVEGRADGIICDLDEDENGNKVPVSDVCIDEIKTIHADVEKMDHEIYVHKAQALCYGYIYASQNNLEKISVQVTYCNPENDEIKRFKSDYTIEEITRWYEELLGSFKRWADFIFDEKAIRQQSIKGLEFPFEYREGQRNLVVSVYKSIQNQKNLYIQAPTGVGKTLSTIFPAVASMGQDDVDKIFYLTSKTITRTVAEETFDILRNNGLRIRTVTLTARDKICILDERNCTASACEYAKGHYDRINDAVYDIITNNYVINRDCIETYAKKHRVCPFELSLDVSYWCDAIICDYNYVFDPNVALKRYFGDNSKGNYVFLVDEAHNLVDRAREMYSAVLLKESFMEAKKLVKDVDKRLAASFEKCNKELLRLKRQCDNVYIMDGVLEISKLLELLDYLGMGIQKFIDNHRTFVYREQLLSIYFDIKHFLNMADLAVQKYVIYTQHTQEGFMIKLFCVDPSDNVAGRTSLGRSTIFFSATLLPVNFYKEMLSGDTGENAIYAESSFDDSCRCVMTAGDVSSRFTRRNNVEYNKICEYIRKTINAHPGKYMVFFPSYSYMEAVYNLFCENVKCLVVPNCNDDVLNELLAVDEIHIAMQNNRMTEQEKEWFLNLFSEHNCKGSLVGFCVIGGIFSEGIDLKNDSLIGAIIVGTGLPMICLERDILRDYFNRNGRDGYAYSYVYPGMNKVLQAAGRVIRTSDDRGIVELLDDRFLTQQYRELFPREWHDHRIISIKSVEGTVEEFWKNACK